MKKRILVVLYAKEPSESATLQSLLNKHEDNSVLTIYNNGPDNINENDLVIKKLSLCFSSVDIIQDLSNKPLSILYNDFLSRDGECFFLFDDDTNVPDGYFTSSNESVDIRVPIIKTSMGEIMYPKVGSKVVTSEYTVPEDVFVYSIGSGLVIYKSLIEVFTKLNLKLFDERYALYGVDVSLFRRIMKLKKSGEQIIIKVEKEMVHSLSRVDESPSPFRLRERLIDNVITLRHYPKSKISSTLFFIKMFTKRLFMFRFSEILLMFNILIKGKHPRCSKI
ncbi:TPA: hypothetical protein R2K53_001285 [Raoultella ornithinolytica]|nr:hypothetical protein [Raoultella ornithinolytica]